MLDLRIGATELIVADVQDHQPVWTCTERRVAGVAELAGLPRVQPRPGLVEPYAVGSAITQELPGRELLRIGRVGQVHDVHEAADAFKSLAEVVRQAVRGEVAHVGRLPVSSMLPFRTGRAQSADSVINDKPRPVELGAREELAPRRCLQSLVRVEHHGVVQVRGRPWIAGGPRRRSPRRRGAAAEHYYSYHSRRSDRSTPVLPAISLLHLGTGPRVPDCSCSRLRNRRSPVSHGVV